MKIVIICILLTVTIQLLIRQIAKDMIKREERKNKEWYDDFMNNGGFDRAVNELGRKWFDDWEDIDEKGGKQ